MRQCGIVMGPEEVATPPQISQGNAKMHSGPDERYGVTRNSYEYCAAKSK